MKAAVDNDILLKGVCYGLLAELLGTIPCSISEAGVLGAARYVLRSRLRKPAGLSLQKATEDVWSVLDAVFREVETLEPSDAEVKIAANLEFAAQRASLPLDTGESLLCAIAMGRNAFLATGDKRAIVALELILDQAGMIVPLLGKVLCLEQLFLRLITEIDPTAVRAAVCGEAGVDRALTACFGCRSESADPATWSEGLNSYIGHLRKDAPRILAR